MANRKIEDYFPKKRPVTSTPLPEERQEKRQRVAKLELEGDVKTSRSVDGPMLLTSTPKASASDEHRKATDVRGNSAPTATTCQELASEGFVPVAEKVPLQKSHILFEFVCDALEAIEQLKGKGAGSKKSACLVLANLFRCVIVRQPEDLTDILFFVLNKLGPDYLGGNILGVGDSIVMKIVAELYGMSESTIKARISEFEDLGAVAAAGRSTTRMLVTPPALDVHSVMAELRAICLVEGTNSQNKKKDKIKKLMSYSKNCEVKFLVRFIQQRLRIGVQSSTVYQALSHAVVLTNPISKINLSFNNPKTETLLTAMEFAVKQSLSQFPDLEIVTTELLRGPTPTELGERCTIRAGVPISPMLAKPIVGIEELLEKHGEEASFTCEYKYDGERCQLHRLVDGSIRLFSRNLENATARFPDIVALAGEMFVEGVEEVIIDAEIVAFDLVEKRILPFQTLATRKKKNVEVSDIKIQVCFYPFDIMRLNGESLLQLTLQQRREKLYQSIIESPGKVQFASHSEISTFDEVDLFLQEAVEAQCEGLIIKTLDSTYEPSKRTVNWTKLKKDYVEALGDSVDAVPIAAFAGRGKRAKGYGAFLMAVYDEESETFQSLCKLATGFSEEELAQAQELLRPNEIPAKRSYYEVSDRFVPDVWFEARNVWEVRAADLSLSPIHMAGIGLRSKDRGIALRFPRFIRFRADKKVENCTTAEQLGEFYDNQKVINRKKQQQAVETNLDDDQW